MIGVFGIILSLGLLMYLAYRGVSALILAPVLAVLAAAVSGLPALASLTQVFMPGMAGFIAAQFPVFILGAILGKVMEDSGSAKAIARAIAARLGMNHAILSVTLSCAVLTYGGVSAFVVAFAVYPIAAHLFREADIPKRLIPATIALGSFTFTMTALPGSPQIQNAIPMPYFHTTAWAAPVIGLVAGTIMLVGGMSWLRFREGKAREKGEGYGAHQGEPVAILPPAGLPRTAVALAPIAIVLLANLILGTRVWKADAAGYGYLAAAPYSTSLGAVRGVWSLVVALGAGIAFVLAANRKRLPKPLDSLNGGAASSMGPILNTAGMVGYGTVVKTLSAFVVLQGALLAISGNPLVTSSIATTALAGITGSASGGMSIALGAMGETFYRQALAGGIAPEILHRVVAIACGGLDSLPHNGAIITLLGITRLSHRQSYADIAMVTIAFPLLALVAAIILGSLGVA